MNLHISANSMKARFLVLACLIFINGCVIGQKVTPVPMKLGVMCVEKSEDIFMDDYLGIIERNLTELKVPFKTVTPEASAGCDTVMRYKAKWRWDIAMYLMFANFAVFKGDERIGYAEYNAGTGGLRPDKFGTTEDKIKPLLRDLFKNQGLKL